MPPFEKLSGGGIRIDTTTLNVLLAGLISLIVAAVTSLVTVQTTTNELTQAQLKDMLARRIEVYPTL